MKSHTRLKFAATLVGLLTVGGAAGYWWQAEQTHAELRQATLAEAEQRATQLADAMAAQMDQLIRGADLALQQLRHEYVTNDRSGFTKTVESVLNTLNVGMIERVALSNAQGMVTYASTGLSGSINVSDREHFRFHASSSEDRLHISAPIFSRVTQRWVILVSRPIIRDGHFSGVMVISLFPEQLSAQLALVALGRDDVAVLLRSDGTFLARSAHWESVMGKSVMGDRPFLRAGAAANGVFVGPGSADGVERIFAWRRLETTGLIASVGLAKAPLLLPLTRDEARAHRLNAVIVAVILVLGGSVSLILLGMARQQRRLVASEARYRMLHESMVDAYAWVDMEGCLIEWNPSFEKMLGYPPEQLRGKNYRDITPARWHGLDEQIIAEQVMVRGYSEVYEKEYIRSDGTVFPIEIRAFLLRDDSGKPLGLWGLVRDITERKLVEAQIHHLAHHDALTGLPNRVALNLRLDQSIAAAQREHKQLAVMLIDLDRFKGINDNLGHLIGDHLLVEVAHRLRVEMRASDIVARLGGDEFIVVLNDAGSREVIEDIAQKLQAILSQPYQIEEHELHTTPSIGISLYPDDGTSTEALIRHADAAMYQAKAQGRDNWQFYTSSLSVAAAERLKIETGLRNALQRHEFVLHYQPQLDIASNCIVAVEALVRWRHPELGLVLPDRFISVAEEMGLIVPLGDWVLDQACAQLRQWHASGLAGIRMCVNLSARQLQRATLQESIADALARHQLSAPDLELEITESMAISNPTETIAVLKKLEALGVTLAIDDFGTGYSSLAYLKLLPIHRLKLDRSFVGDIETDPEDASICRATASLTHDLGLTLVAEGVETEAQFNFLKGLGCDLLQGYWLANPLPADEARDVILRHNDVR